MKNLFRDNFVKMAFSRIQSGKMTEETIFKLLEMYFKKPLSDFRKEKARMYIEKIRSGEMSYDEYMKKYKGHTNYHDKPIDRRKVEKVNLILEKNKAIKIKKIEDEKNS